MSSSKFSLGSFFAGLGAGGLGVAAVIAGLVAVLAYAGLQRMGVIGGVPLDTKVAARVSGSYKIKKPNEKNIKAYVEADDPSITIEDVGSNKWKIVDIHEHAQNEVEAARLLKGMDSIGVQRTCLQAATIYTFTLNNKYGFEQFEENNEAIINIKKKWPDRFCAFITFDPAREGNLELVKEAVKKGADGVKLFIGHGAATGKGPFHVMPIDDPRLEPFWAWAEETQLPVLMHVNLIKYWDETVSLLEKHPNLRLCLPHFGLHKNTEWRLNRLAWLMDRYPNVYSDMSYGYYTFQIEGFESLSKHRTRSRAFLQKYAHRLMFATDMVLEKTKDDVYIADTMRSYRQWNEEKTFRLYLVPSKLMHGMDLSDETLTKIYETAPANFLMTDAQGRLPDRTQNPKPPYEFKVVPPLDKETIPHDPQYQPRAEGEAFASSATLKDAKKQAPEVYKNTSSEETAGGGGEGPEDPHTDCEGEDH